MEQELIRVLLTEDNLAEAELIQHALAPDGGNRGLAADVPTQRRPPADVFTLYSGSEVAQLVADAGFRDARVEDYPQPDRFPGECILAVK